MATLGSFTASTRGTVVPNYVEDPVLCDPGSLFRCLGPAKRDVFGRMIFSVELRSNAIPL